MRLKCIVIDDEPLAAALISDYIRRTEGLQLLSSFTDPLKAIDMVKNEAVDLVFLDIQMPEMNGLQFMEATAGFRDFILTTAYEQYAIPGFDHHVIDYLLKPVTYERFSVAVSKARERISSEQMNVKASPEFIFIRSGYKMIRVEMNDIYYLEGARDYTNVHTSQGKLMTLQNMSSFEHLLPASRFCRIHRSYIVNIGRIVHVEKNIVHINNQDLPVSETYRDQFSLLIQR